MKKSINLYDYFYIVFIICIGSWYLLPVIRYSVPIFYVAPLATIFIVVYFFRYRFFMNEVLFYFGLYGIVAMMYVLVAYPFNLKKGVQIFMEQFMLFFPYYVYRITKRTKLNMKMTVFFSISMMFVFVLISTFIAFGTEPGVARMLTRGSTDELLMAYRMQNIGGYGFSYSIVFLTLFFLTLALETQLTKLKVISVALMGTCLYYLVLAQFGIAILLVGSGIVFILGYRINGRALKWIVITASLLLFAFLPSIMEQLALVLNSETLYVRFMGLAELIRHGRTSELDIVYRIQYLKDGIELFMISPIWGNSLLDPTNLRVALSTHSTYLELVCSGGIIALSAYLTATISHIRKMSKTISDVGHRKGYFVICFIFIIMGMINPTWQAYELGLTLFLFIPLGYNLCGRN